MKSRKASLSVIGMVMALVAAACGGTASSNNPSTQTGTLTVWLMNGSAPQSVVDGVNADFKAKYPNVTVNVELSKGGETGTNPITAFAAARPPTLANLATTLVPRHAEPGAPGAIGANRPSSANSE